MKEKIQQKIKEVEALLIKTKINPTTADYYHKLLEIADKLKDFLYFKVNQEKNWLIPR